MLTDALQATFNGLSLASILILMGLGLSIVFGLMDVINMAHGEFMMFGAFTTDLVAEGFKRWLNPPAYSWYWLCVPVAVITVCGGAGALCERYLIRRLSRGDREGSTDLEADSLLVTIGLSTIMIELVKLGFGNNESVLAPNWLVGGVVLFGGVTLPRNRLFIIAYTAVIFSSTLLILNRTATGRMIRAATQNRDGAREKGIDEELAHFRAFVLGVILAGLAGAPLTLVYSINPEIGATYIIFAFLVVMVAGKGNIMGVLWAGVALGLLTKYLEPSVGAVVAQILVSMSVVVYLLTFEKRIAAKRGRANYARR